MIARRTLLAGAATVPVHFNWTAAHPDAALLALCAQLADMQADWQRLYDATSDADQLTTPADFAWQEYSDTVWPGLNHSTWKGRDPADVPGRLLDLRATTPAGLQAKAAAILAMDEASSYGTDCRDDSLDLSLSLIRDAAGNAHRPLDAAARLPTPLRPDAHAA